MEEIKLTDAQLILSLRACESEENCAGCHLTPPAGNCFRELKRMARVRLEELAEENRRMRDATEGYVAELAKLREENRWIPVEERLPDKELDEIAEVVNTELHYPGFLCLVMFRGGKYPTIMNYADIDGDREWVDDECDWHPVTHWKPMPKGPEVGHE